MDSVIKIIMSIMMMIMIIIMIIKVSSELEHNLSPSGCLLVFHVS